MHGVQVATVEPDQLEDDETLAGYRVHTLGFDDDLVDVDELVVDTVEEEDVHVVVDTVEEEDVRVVVETVEEEDVHVVVSTHDASGRGEAFHSHPRLTLTLYLV